MRRIVLDGACGRDHKPAHIDAEAKRQREQGLKPAEVARPVRENTVILDEPTEAQSRVLDECLDQSSG